MYAISYHLMIGTTVHRAISAKAALEALTMIQKGGGAIVKITSTRSGEEISQAELRRLAEHET